MSDSDRGGMRVGEGREGAEGRGEGKRMGQWRRGGEALREERMKLRRGIAS